MPRRSFARTAQRWLTRLFPIGLFPIASLPIARFRIAPFLIGLLLIGLSATRADAQTQYDSLRLIAPAAPGGGWDQTARAMQRVLQQTGIARLAPVENIAGAAGTIGLSRLISAERGRSDVIMVSGLIMLAAIVTHGSPVTLQDVTPIARLTGEYEVIVVPAASPYRTIQELLQAFKTRPESMWLASVHRHRRTAETCVVYARTIQI